MLRLPPRPCKDPDHAYQAQDLLRRVLAVCDAEPLAQDLHTLACALPDAPASSLRQAAIHAAAGRWPAAAVTLHPRGRTGQRHHGRRRFRGPHRAAGECPHHGGQGAAEGSARKGRAHLWSNLCDKTLAEVRSHTTCWATAVNPARPGGLREQTTRERWHQVHDLLGKGVGLLECARRLDLALNTVKRYARRKEPTAERRAPQYRPTLVDPFRDHLRRHRAEDPAVPVTYLLREIKELGYTGSANLLVRYITQGRAEGDRPVTTARCLSRLLLTRPDNLRDKDAELLRELTATCAEMTELACFVGEFAGLLFPAEANDAKLTDWITQVRAVDLPHLHSFANGLELDRVAVNAGLALPYHNGRTEGVNTRTKRIMRQMHGRAGFPLLRQRILLQ
ncbi:hypothetical protein ABH931_002761 [Streptacidiphilus sp. MAP12-33]